MSHNIFSAAALQESTPFVCPNDCGKRYKYKRGLYRHLHECGKEPRYNCTYCGKWMYRRDHLKQHLILTHRILQPVLNNITTSTAAKTSQ